MDDPKHAPGKLCTRLASDAPTVKSVPVIFGGGGAGKRLSWSLFGKPWDLFFWSPALSRILRRKNDRSLSGLSRIMRSSRFCSFTHNSRFSLFEKSPLKKRSVFFEKQLQVTFVVRWGPWKKLGKKPISLLWCFYNIIYGRGLSGQRNPALKMPCRCSHTLT